jgi:hypothetical protein
MKEYENNDLDIDFTFESDLENMEKIPWYKTKKEYDKYKCNNCK